MDSPQSENARWFAEKVLPHNAQLKAYLRGAFPSVREVNDVVQESYLRVWRRHLARPVESAKAFLFQVARRHALDSVRRDCASPIDAAVDVSRLDAAEESTDTFNAACTREETELLFAAIDALPASCRAIVILRKIEGVPKKEIARRLGLSESTVQVQASRGLRRCAEFMRERGVGAVDVQS